LHAIRNGNNERKRFGAYKVDLTKAYDRVDWGYLEGVLIRLGFHSKWIGWVMECVTTVHYAIRFNNVSPDPFAPARGLRQGDPLLPYLFLFVADDLSKLIHDQVAKGELRQLMSADVRQVSHLLFADDTLLFMVANRRQAEVINRVLRYYERNTGKLINPAKCSIMFRAGCLPDNITNVQEVLGVGNITQDEKYLGLPTLDERMSKEKFNKA
jgi:hypothetical protein